MCELVLTQERRDVYSLWLRHCLLGQLSFQVNKDGFISAPQHSILIFQKSPGELNQCMCKGWALLSGSRKKVVIRVCRIDCLIF